MAAERPARLRLFDILDSISGVEQVMARCAQSGIEPGVEQWRAIERWIEIISEASRHVPPDMQAQEPEIPWRQIADIGNIIRHSYDRVDPTTLREIVEDDLPPLRVAAERLYTACKKPTDPWP